MTASIFISYCWQSNYTLLPLSHIFDNSNPILSHTHISIHNNNNNKFLTLDREIHNQMCTESIHIKIPSQSQIIFETKIYEQILEFCTKAESLLSGGRTTTIYRMLHYGDDTKEAVSMCMTYVYWACWISTLFLANNNSNNINNNQCLSFPGSSFKVPNS